MPWLDTLASGSELTVVGNSSDTTPLGAGAKHGWRELLSRAWVQRRQGLGTCTPSLVWRGGSRPALLYVALTPAFGVSASAAAGLGQAAEEGSE